MAVLGGYIYTSCFVQLFLPATPYGASLRRADHGLGQGVREAEAVEGPKSANSAEGKRGLRAERTR